MHRQNSSVYHVALQTAEQLTAVCDYISQNRDFMVSRLILSCDLLIKDDYTCNFTINTCHSLRDLSSDTEMVIQLPFMMRASDYPLMDRLLEILNTYDIFQGILCPDLEGTGFFKSKEYKGKYYADAGFYLWNSSAVCFWKDVFSGACLPYELKAAEQHALVNATLETMPWEKVVYGRIPMMRTANCVQKTTAKCLKNSKDKSATVMLTDRMGKKFPVQLNCLHCINTIYNSVPLSLHNETEKWSSVSLRLDFTLESGRETFDILDFYSRSAFEKCSPPFDEYTTGHEKRGVQ